MFKLVFLAGVMLVSTCAFSQHFSIFGTVKDKSGQELEGATIQILKLDAGQWGFDRAVVSDRFGRFTVNKIPKGEYSIRIRFLGYHEKTEIVSVLSDNVALKIILEESAQLTEEVIVFATRANDKTPTTFSNISEQELQKQNFGQDMPFLLNWTPSLVTTSDAGGGIGYTGLRIRGSDATRINVTINGIAYNDSESQGTFWVNIPDIASSTQSVQIQRGVGTSTNGAGSFGGSVNVQTISRQPDPYTQIMMGAGSFNSQRITVKAGTGLINNRWSFDGRASKISSDGYIDRASSNLSSYYFSGGYYGDKTIVKGIAFGGHEKTYQAWNGIDAVTMKTNRTFNSAGALYDQNWNVIGYYDNEVDNYRQDHYQLHLNQRLGKYWNGNFAIHLTDGRGYFEQYKQNMFFAELGLSDIVLSDTTLTSGDFIVRRWLDNKFYGATFSINYEKEKATLSVGGAYNQYTNAKHFGEIIWAQHAANSQIRQHYYNGESEKNDFNVYAKWNYEIIPALNAFADLQYRHVTYSTLGIDDDQSSYDVSDRFDFFNPKVGVSFTLSENDVLYGSYAVANREPNRTDYLNSEVKPKSERLDNIETGWRRNSDGYSIEINYYWMNYINQLVLTGELDNVGNPVRANVGKSYRTGIEASTATRLTEQLTLNANITWAVNKNIDFVLDEANLSDTRNTAIILSPTWIASSMLTWNPFKDFQASLLTKYVGKQYLDNSENSKLTLDQYFLNDVRFNYAFTLKSAGTLEVSLLVNNLFDLEYASSGYAYAGLPYYYPQAGINFLATAMMKF